MGPLAISPNTSPAREDTESDGDNEQDAADCAHLRVSMALHDENRNSQ